MCVRARRAGCVGGILGLCGWVGGGGGCVWVRARARVCVAEVSARKKPKRVVVAVVVAVITIQIKAINHTHSRKLDAVVVAPLWVFRDAAPGRPRPEKAAAAAQQREADDLADAQHVARLAGAQLGWCVCCVERVRVRVGVGVDVCFFM